MDGYPSISLLDNSGALYLFLLILKLLLLLIVEP